MKTNKHTGTACKSLCAILLLLSFLSMNRIFAQADSNLYKKEQSEMIKKAKEAQQQAMEQLKKMGISIDPNKKMSKQDIAVMKDKLLQQAQQMKDQIQAKQENKTVHANVDISKTITQAQVQAIVNRFYNRSYKQLNAVNKTRFDQDYKQAAKDSFSKVAVRILCNKGASLITFGNDHNIACVYLAAAVKALSGDTLSINNFGAYLRIIDSVKASLPVLLYANQLFDKSPVVLTQIGFSLLELNDDKKAEDYFKRALKCDPDFGPAHTALCETYIRQKRFKEAIAELFAGVKGWGGSSSYGSLSANFSNLQQQAENSDTKEDFWNETGKQVKPEDALAPLVPDDNRIKMPSFPSCAKHADWMEGGGYNAAVKAFGKFNKALRSFAEEFQRVHKEVPAIPANAILKDCPNERFALDCILEYFQKKSAKEAKDNSAKMDEIRNQMVADGQIYTDKYTQFTQQYIKCVKGCGNNDYCAKECFRKYCLNLCPAANEYNQKLQASYDNYAQAFIKTKENQEKLLDDLFAFTGQWFNKIQGAYWSKIYAYEIKRVALSIIANCYGAYPQAFLFPAHTQCGTDCSVFINPYPDEAGQAENKETKGHECPEDSKQILHLFFCEVSLTCEYFEVGCTEGVSASVRRNFGKEKSTTIFLGGGVEAGLGAVGASAKFGPQLTITDEGSVDVGFRGSVSGTLTVPGPHESQVHVPGSGNHNGVESEFTLTIMGGMKTETMKTSTTGFGKEVGGDE